MGKASKRRDSKRLRGHRARPLAGGARTDSLSGWINQQTELIELALATALVEKAICDDNLDLLEAGAAMMAKNGRDIVSAR